MNQMYETWREQAACRDQNLTDLFFDGDNGNFDKAGVICGTCPVREQCRVEARSHYDTKGFWAGETEDERRRARRRENARDRMRRYQFSEESAAKVRS